MKALDKETTFARLEIRRKHEDDCDSVACEIRGSSISGGERKSLGPGDVVQISAGIPHQLLLDAGRQFTYFVVKIDTK
jgi:hypothetical protein